MDNQEAVKQAAQRMTAFFSEHGVQVKHSLALEGIAKSFGLSNWRKLKDALDAPRVSTTAVAVAAAVVPPAKRALPLGEMQCWRVRGILSQESQPYGDDFYGRTPLEAAIDCIISHKVKGEGIGISEVLDADEEMALQPWSLDSIVVHDWHKALSMLTTNVLNVVSSVYSERQYVVATWLNAVLRQQSPEDFDRLAGYLENRVEPNQDFVGRLRPSKMLSGLAQHVIDRCGGVEVLEAKDSQHPLATACYQVMALSEYACTAVNAKDSPLMTLALRLPVVSA